MATDSMRFPGGYVPAEAPIPDYVGLKKMPDQQKVGMEMAAPFVAAGREASARDEEARKAEDFKKVLEMGQQGMYQYTKELEPTHPELAKRLKAQVDGYTPLFQMKGVDPKNYQDFMLDFYDNAEKQRNQIDQTKTKNSMEGLRQTNRVEFEKLKQENRLALEKLKARLFSQYKKTGKEGDYQFTADDANEWLSRTEQAIKDENEILLDNTATYSERKAAMARIKELEDDVPKIKANLYKATQHGAKVVKTKRKTVTTKEEVAALADGTEFSLNGKNYRKSGNSAVPLD